MSLLRSIFGKAAPKKAILTPGEVAFEIQAGQTVLESALKLGIAYPHDCTVGTCGSCRSKLLSGRVEAITPFSYTLSREELDAGYILACQALAKTDLSLEVDVTGSESQTLTQPAVLVASEDLTHDIKRLTWRLQTPLRWRAGQYVNVRWNDGEAHRSYSLATAPLPEGASEVSTFVRHVPGGAFTDLVFTGDLGGARFEVNGPHGNFWLREGAGPILCIAGGSGLAPILSLLEDAARKRVRRDCLLLFGARTNLDLYGLREITAIRNAWTAGFDFWPVLSQERVDGYRNGMVTDHLDAAMARLGPGVQAYMCGPPPMIDAAIHALSGQGVGLGDIHYDKFTDASTRGAAAADEREEP
jgi:p-cymene monooxygenase electron transfer component